MSLYKETTGYLIHQRNYKNSSLILEIFSCDFGMIHLIAKGIKNNKRLKSQLQYFSHLKIQFYGKSNLKTLVSIDVLNFNSYENIIDKTAGLYINELLHYSLIEYEKVDTLYHCYQQCLLNIGKNKITPILRYFEKELLKHNGFELSVNPNLQDDCWIGINENQGIIEAQKSSDKLCLNSDLKLIVTKIKPNHQAQKRINKFMRHAIDLSLNYKRLYSRELLISMTSKNS